MSDDSVHSPCRNICQLIPGDRVCVGCGRTSEEIASWLQAGSAERREILARAAIRLTEMVNKD